MSRSGVNFKNLDKHLDVPIVSAIPIASSPDYRVTIYNIMSWQRNKLMNDITDLEVYISYEDLHGCEYMYMYIVYMHMCCICRIRVHVYIHVLMSVVVVTPKGLFSDQNDSFEE